MFSLIDNQIEMLYIKDVKRLRALITRSMVLYSVIVGIATIIEAIHPVYEIQACIIHALITAMLITVYYRAIKIATKHISQGDN